MLFNFLLKVRSKEDRCAMNCAEKYLKVSVGHIQFLYLSRGAFASKCLVFKGFFVPQIAADSN
jgi:hypothetical protein